MASISLQCLVFVPGVPLSLPCVTDGVLFIRVASTHTGGNGAVTYDDFDYVIISTPLTGSGIGLNGFEDAQVLYKYPRPPAV